MIGDLSFQTLAERSRDMLSIVDKDGVFVYVNPAWTRALGWQPSELVGSWYLDFVHPDDVEDTLSIVAAQAQGGDANGCINRYRTKDGLYRNVQWWSDPGEDGLLYASARDVTELQRSSSRAAEIEDVSGVCSWEVDIETNDVYWSPGTMRLVGWPEDRQPTLKEALSFYPEESRAKLEPVFAKLMETGEPYSVEMTHLRVGGGSFLARATGAAELRNGKVMRAYGTFEDITERRQVEEDILDRERRLREAAEAAYQAESNALKEQAWAAKHDSLTGLGNRQLLQDELRNVEGDDQRFLVLAIDLDRFKDVNDSFGNEAGDHVLIQTAKCMQDATTGPHDKLFRIGGDEFVMLVDSQSMALTSHSYCEWLLDQFLESTQYQGVELGVGASVGYAESSVGTTVSEALRRADMALHAAKAQGRNQVLAYRDTIGAAHLEKLALANDLRIAVEKGGIGIALQPQTHAASGELCGCEVLARWTHPTRGVIPPNVFVELADELNLLSQLDKIVLDQALLAHAELARRGLVLPKIAVNVSAKRLSSPGLVDEILDRPDLPENGLAFEILETAFLDKIADDVCATVNALRAHGIHIEVDDFGTGHASFASVLALQPDVLKFDRIFVEGIEHDEGRRELMEGLLKIARNVGAETLVEGIENQAQADVMVELGVDYLQGYAIGRPMSVDMLLEWAEAKTPGLVPKIA